MDIFIESKKENGRGPAALQLGPFAECCYAFQSRTGIIGDTGGGRREKNCGFSSSSFSLQTTRPIRGPRWLIVSTTVKGGKNALLELAANQQVEKQTHTRWRGVASSQLFFFLFFYPSFPLSLFPAAGMMSAVPDRRLFYSHPGTNSGAGITTRRIRVTTVKPWIHPLSLFLYSTFQN